MLRYVTSGLLISILSTGTLAYEGCNDAVRRGCSNGVASVCINEKCPGAVIGGELFKRTMLEKHNEYRKRAFTNGSYGADMIEVTWDDQLANSALGWVQHLCAHNAFHHDSYECRSTQRFNSVGQNLMGGSTGYRNEADIATQAVDMWFQEINKISADRMFPFQWTPAAGHYTEVVWATVYKIGCAMTKVESSTFPKVVVACNYGPSGNFIGRNVFNPSHKLGSACRPGTQNRGSGLCQVTNEAEYRRHIGLRTVPSSR